MMRRVQDGIYVSDFKDPLNNKPYNKDPIYLVQQFFIHKNDKRLEEIKFCLKKNIQLDLFEKIILLNEQVYSKEELGLNANEMSKVLQININRRMKYSDALDEIQKQNIQGYIVIANSDIFFDKTIQNVRRSCLSITKSIYSLLRFEYKGEKKLGYCKLFTFGENQSHLTNKPRYDSQDTWIYHTSQMNVNKQILELTSIFLGMPGCDNKITFNFHSLGFKCFNTPWNVKTYHNHQTQIRNYTSNDVIQKPYLFLLPIL